MASNEDQKLLHLSTYRDLQRTAKELGLPCNVKKVMLRKLIKAKVEGDQEEVAQLLAEVVKKKFQKEKEIAFWMQVIKEKKDTEKTKSHQVKDATSSLTKNINRKPVTNDRIKRISKTEVHTESVGLPAGQTTCKSFMQSSTNNIGTSSTFVPLNPEELMANSSNYTDDKKKFSPKHTSGSCRSKHYLPEDLPRNYVRESGPPDYSDNQTIRHAPALPDNFTKLLNYTATTLDGTASTITSSDPMRLHNKAQTDTTVSASADFWRIPTTVPSISDQVKDATSSLTKNINRKPVSNDRIKRISKTEVHTESVGLPAGQTTCKSFMQSSTNNIGTSSTFVPLNPEELMANSSNYTDDKKKFSPKHTSGSCRSKHYLPEDLPRNYVRESGPPDYSDNQTIRHAPALPDNFTKLLNYTATTLDGIASTITSSDPMRLHNKAQTDTTVSASADFWRIPTTVPSISDQVKDATSSLRYLQRIINRTPVPNVTIKRISETEVHTECAEPPAGQTTCKSFMQSSKNNVCASSTFVPLNPEELMANSSNYTDDKTKFSPKLTSGSCCSKRYLPEDPLPKWLLLPLKRSEKKNIKRESYYGINPDESSWLNHHNSLTNSDNHSGNPINQKLHIPHSSYNHYQTPVFTNISDGPKKHNSQTRSTLNFPVGSNHTRNSSSYNTSSTFLQNSSSAINYPFQPSSVIFSENQNKNNLSCIRESGPPDYSDNQTIRHAPALPDNFTKLLNYTATTLDGTASTITTSDQMRLHNEAQTDTTVSASSYLHDSYPFADFWRIPTTVPSSSDQVFCHYGCKTTFFSAEDQTQHEMNCLLKVVSCPSELCYWMYHLHSLSNHIFYAHNREVIAKPETYFLVEFKNYKVLGIDDPSLFRVKRFSFFQTHEQRLYVIKVSVDETTLNVQAYIQYINDGLGSLSLALMEVCCPNGLPVRWFGSVHPFSLNPVHILISNNCLQFKMDADGWTNNFSLHVKLF